MTRFLLLLSLANYGHGMQKNCSSCLCDKTDCPLSYAILPMASHYVEGDVLLSCLTMLLKPSAAYSPLSALMISLYHVCPQRPRNFVWTLKGILNPWIYGMLERCSKSNDRPKN